MTEPIVPADFVVPRSFDGPGFRLEPLGPERNVGDHAAWMSSVDHIRSTPGFEGGDWPEPMSLEANRDDLVRHAGDFAARTGFTYSILDGVEVIGCLYLYPPSDPNHDVDVRSWLRESRADDDAEVRLAIAEWIEREWPFSAPMYHGVGGPG